MSATESLYDDNSFNYSESQLVYTPFLINAAPWFVKKNPLFIRNKLKASSTGQMPLVAATVILLMTVST